MRIYAFNGMRYAAGDAGRLAAPPFDQIGPALSRRLHASDSSHFSHLTRPAEGAEGAAALHADWIRHGIVTREPEPALYRSISPPGEDVDALGLRKRIL